MKRVLMLFAVLALCLPMVGETQSIQHKGAGGGSEPWSLTSPIIWDEFVTGLNTTGNSGDLGWNALNGTVTFSAGEANRPGIYGLASCGAAATCVSFINTTAYPIQTQNVNTMVWIYRSTSVANEPKRRIGLTAAISSDPSDHGIYFERLAADANWTAVTRAAASETKTDTGVAFASNTWFRLEFRRLSATSVAFYINGSLVATNNATVPAATQTLMPWVHHVGTGTANAFELDYFFLSLSVSGR